MRLDPLTRGRMIHAMHATTLRRLKKAGMLPLVAAYKRQIGIYTEAIARATGRPARGTLFHV